MSFHSNRCVIVGGAAIFDYEYIRSCLKDNDYIIFCDSGLMHIRDLNVKPNLIVGDFDSAENPNMDVETTTDGYGTSRQVEVKEG